MILPLSYVPAVQVQFSLYNSISFRLKSRGLTGFSCFSLVLSNASLLVIDKLALEPLTED